MKYTDQGLEATHAEMCKWLDWYVAVRVKQGLHPSKAKFLGSALANFLASGVHYINIHEKLGVKCPKCQGRGHNNLFLAGQDKPGACKNCNGTGEVFPANQDLKDPGKLEIEEDSI